MDIFAGSRHRCKNINDSCALVSQLLKQHVTTAGLLEAEAAPVEEAILSQKDCCD